MKVAKPHREPWVQGFTRGGDSSHLGLNYVRIFYHGGDHYGIDWLGLADEQHL